MKEMKIGMIGAGFMAKAHAIAYAGMPMFFWPAPVLPVKQTIVDIREETARESAKRLGFASYETDWRKMIEDPQIDIVDICTPNNVHAEIAIAAAKAGKHILCEKPMALTSQQAEEMYLAAKENKITTMVAFNYRRTPAVQLAKKYIEEGALGQLLDFRGTYLQDWVRRSGFSALLAFSEKHLRKRRAGGYRNAHRRHAALSGGRVCVGECQNGDLYPGASRSVRADGQPGQRKGPGGYAQKTGGRGRSLLLYGTVRKRRLRNDRSHQKCLGSQQLYYL